MNLPMCSSQPRNRFPPMIGADCRVSLHHGQAGPAAKFHQRHQIHPGQPGDPLPLDISRLSPATFVGEVVMRQAMTSFLQSAQARGCRFQIGTDMLFEQIPAYLEFFGFPTATPERLRELATIKY
jgi:hypothetical protein